MAFGQELVSLIFLLHDNILFIGDRVKYIGTIAPPGFALQTPLRYLSLFRYIWFNLDACQ